MLNNLKQRQRTLAHVTQGYWSTQMAAQNLGLSCRQIQRLKQTPKSDDRVPVPWNRKSQAVIDLVVSLKEDYPHRSNQRIAELVSDRLGESLCYETVRKILIEEQKYDPHVRPARSYGRFEATAFGQLLQLDTTEGVWLEGYRRVYLILVVDDYSRMIVGFKWVDSDSTWNNLMVLKEILNRYGKPGGIYTDNSSKFKTIRHGTSLHMSYQGSYETEIQRVMRELGVPFFSHKPYEPTSKGKIERLFRFIQDRFITEHSATTLEELNTQFNAWVRWYNEEHVIRTTSCKPKERVTPNGWTPLLENTDRVFRYKDTRKVDKRHEFSYEGFTYVLPPEPCVVACTVQLEMTPETISVYWHDHKLAELKRQTKN
jgi:transposase InsO family protein